MSRWSIAMGKASTMTMVMVMKVMGALTVGGAPAAAATSSKFGAWATAWRDSAIPLQLPREDLDVRQERQYAGACIKAGQAGCEDVITRAMDFALHRLPLFSWGVGYATAGIDWEILGSR
jgi:hypothetical protein